MSAGAATPLAGQRQALREQLGLQRARLARALAGGGNGGYPRSITVRWLIQEPELVTRLAAKVVGGRVAAAVPVVLVLVRFLRTATQSPA